MIPKRSIIFAQNGGMISFPNAKINLGLAITDKRADGFHNIETCFYPIPLYDVLEFVESDTFELSLYGHQLDGKISDNLLTKVWQLMNTLYQIPPIKAALLKNIPAGAGLGGGSSDASFLIKGLNDLFLLGLSHVEMENLAVSLGSDCPFFIRNRPAIGTGRGEVLSEISLSLTGYYLTLVFPQVHISTATAFQHISPRHPDHSIAQVLLQAPKNWRGRLHNSFQSVSIQMYPVIGQIIDQLYEIGADYASLTGSGSSVFALSEIPLETHGRFNDLIVYSWKL